MSEWKMHLRESLRHFLRRSPGGWMACDRGLTSIEHAGLALVVVLATGLVVPRMADVLTSPMKTVVTALEGAGQAGHGPRRSMRRDPRDAVAAVPGDGIITSSISRHEAPRAPALRRGLTAEEDESLPLR